MGRPVKYLVKNGILGIKGNWTWDGLDDKNNPLPVGTYIISAEIFNLQGKKRQFKKTIVLARQF
jgi:Flagellar hook capping protein